MQQFKGKIYIYKKQIYNCSNYEFTLSEIKRFFLHFDSWMTINSGRYCTQL